ncbi:hypothetical protein K402DRAFT_463693 [Aulographum hederae CBS 113979]|uniref:Uncharacterized protein n=1 Tax=Aulographum hederae CBS 113979 TaxID=1176131 RepID=A0A6G1H0B1_9PEZI|nr:hypothetical protein K402DRAFT_463693 [Aulographum hederae CBS 113979]
MSSSKPLPTGPPNNEGIFSIHRCPPAGLTLPSLAGDISSNDEERFYRLAMEALRSHRAGRKQECIEKVDVLLEHQFPQPGKATLPLFYQLQVHMLWSIAARDLEEAESHQMTASGQFEELKEQVKWDFCKENGDPGVIDEDVRNCLEWLRKWVEWCEEKLGIEKAEIEKKREARVGSGSRSSSENDEERVEYADEEDSEDADERRMRARRESESGNSREDYDGSLGYTDEEDSEDADERRRGSRRGSESGDSSEDDHDDEEEEEEHVEVINERKRTASVLSESESSSSEEDEDDHGACACEQCARRMLQNIKEGDEDEDEQDEESSGQERVELAKALPIRSAAPFQGNETSLPAPPATASYPTFALPGGVQGLPFRPAGSLRKQASYPDKRRRLTEPIRADAGRTMDSEQMDALHPSATRRATDAGRSDFPILAAVSRHTAVSGKMDASVLPAGPRPDETQNEK